MSLKIKHISREQKETSISSLSAGDLFSHGKYTHMLLELPENTGVEGCCYGAAFADGKVYMFSFATLVRAVEGTLSISPVYEEEE